MNPREGSEYSLLEYFFFHMLIVVYSHTNLFASIKICMSKVCLFSVVEGWCGSILLKNKLAIFCQEESFEEESL